MIKKLTLKKLVLLFFLIVIVTFIHLTPYIILPSVFAFFRSKILYLPLFFVTLPLILANFVLTKKKYFLYAFLLPLITLIGGMIILSFSPGMGDPDPAAIGLLIYGFLGVLGVVLAYIVTVLLYFINRKNKK